MQKRNVSGRSRIREKVLERLPGPILLAILFLLTILAWLVLTGESAFGVVANPEPVEFIQPDGTAIEVYLRGDEHFHWNADGTGFPIVRSNDGRSWVYAREEDGALAPTSVPAGSVDPVAAGLQRPDVRAMWLRAAKESSPMLEGGGEEPPAGAPPLGVMKNLVVLVNYADLSITQTRQDFDDLFNQAGYSLDGAVGSVRDYYDEVSYGQIDVQSTVVEPVTVSQGYAYYGANSAYGYDLRPREMVSEALAALEARGFDFSSVDGDGDGWVDGLTIIHAGGGEEYSGNDPDYIWSHKWALSTTVTYDGTRMREYHTEPARRGWDSTPSTWGITRIGVICHETGHFIGLPDLYDYDYDSRGAGRFCLMAGGSWNGDSGASPAHMSAWCKTDLGWVTPTGITGGGLYTADQVETNAQIYKLQGGFASNEYFLVENRQPAGFDAELPGTTMGLLIWHVDENQPNNDDQTHYLVDLEEASGTQELENNVNSGDDADYFHLYNMDEFSGTTTPNNLSYGGTPLGLDITGISVSGPSMTFTVNGLVLTLDSPNGGETLTVGGVHQVSWTVDGDIPDSISIYLSIDGGANYDHPVASGLSGTTYGWTVPNLPVATARLLVSAYQGGGVISSDVSDADFTIEGSPYRYVSASGANIYPYSLPSWAAHDIRDAIDAAEPGDSIMVEAGTYNYALSVDRGVYLMGGWDASFTTRDPAVNVTTLQANSSVVSFVSIASGTPGIEGFNIAGGTGTNALIPVNGVYGGGIFVYEAPAVIKGNVIDGCGIANVSGFTGGGGIAVYNSTVTIEGNTITNSLAQSGGGIYLYQAAATVSGNTISGSQPNAEYNGDKHGGGICARSSNLTLSGNTITGNTGYIYGGGVYARFTPVSIDGDVIEANDAGSNGGGVYTERSALSITGASVVGNTAASSGGGIYHRAESFDMSNSLVALNESSVIGGGVYADSCWGGWENNTIDRNTTGSAGGNVMLSTAVSQDVRNNLFTYGSPSGFQAATGTGIVYEYNNAYGNSGEDVVTLVPDSTNISSDPRYADTTAMDYHLAAHSGAVDAGDPAVLDPDGSVSDQGLYGGPAAVFAAPAYVQNLFAAAVGDTTVRLSWDGRLPGGLDYYAIYADTSAGFAPTASNFIGTAPAAADTFLHEPASGCNYYRVSLVDASGYASGYSNEAGACAAGPDLLPPTVAVVYPNGGEAFAPGDTVTIQWTATDNDQVSTVDIYYSENGGTDYTLIADGEPNDLEYDWVLPGIASDSMLVRVVAWDPAALSGEDEGDGMFSVQPATDAGDTPALATALRQNFPNPFNPTTRIAYTLARSSRVALRIYDVSGRLVKTLVDGSMPAGNYEEIWNGTDNGGGRVASGVYFYRLSAPGFVSTRKMVLLR